MNHALIITGIASAPFLLSAFTALVITLQAVITGRDPWMEDPKLPRSKSSSNWPFRSAKASAN